MTFESHNTGFQWALTEERLNIIMNWHKQQEKKKVQE